MFVTACASLISCTGAAASTAIVMTAKLGYLPGGTNLQLATLLLAGALAVLSPLLPVLAYHTTTRE